MAAHKTEEFGKKEQDLAAFAKAMKDNSNGNGIDLWLSDRQMQVIV